MSIFVAPFKILAFFLGTLSGLTFKVLDDLHKN